MTSPSVLDGTFSCEICRALVLRENRDGHNRTHDHRAGSLMECVRDRRQLASIMFALNELLPGVVCLDSACPEGRIPHMANDSGNHPRPYGLIETPTHEWRRKPWWRR